MSNWSRYSLVFVNWNTADLTIAAVRSAQRTVANPEALRVLVVDNGSSDGSAERLASELPEAEILALPENRGFAKAVNAGLRRVRERFAFVLNSDIEFRNNALGILAETLQSDPAAVLACPDLLRPDGTHQPAAVPEPTIFWELVDRSLPRHWLRLHPEEATVVPSIVGPCMAVHMERLEAVGLLDERFFFFFEETDWCRRMTQAGLHVLYVPAARVVHLQGGAANRRPVRARVQFYDSRYRYFRKHCGPGWTAMLAVGLWAKLSVKLLLYSLLVVLSGGARRRRDKVAVCAVLWFWHVRRCRPKWGFEP